MKKISLIMLYLAMFSSIEAVSAEDPNTKARAAPEVVLELSQKSGLPEAELNSVLADCNANQQAMYFCAWRDQIAADHDFNRQLEEKKYVLKVCEDALEAYATKWKSSRNRSCMKSAQKEFDDGSMRPTAQAMCMAAETKRMTSHLKRINSCNRANWR